MSMGGRLHARGRPGSGLSLSVLGEYTENFSLVTVTQVRDDTMSMGGRLHARGRPGSGLTQRVVGEELGLARHLVSLTVLNSKHGRPSYWVLVYCV
ncbi:hypothetical protein J6590_022886 [Homalodisca vitripennis]|nr:hypothetical protein J6590_022886 [Homalodisca vitripennis]